MTTPLAKNSLLLTALALVLASLPGVQADVATDPAGDAPAASLDIVSLRVENDGASSLDLVVEVDDMTVSPPSGTPVITYFVDFCTSHNGAICYRYQANNNNDVVTADFFRGRVINADGSSCAFTDLLTSGAFEPATNTVRWTVPKAALDFTTAPTNAMSCASGVRTGSALADGDAMTAMSARTEASTVGGTTVVVDSTSSGSHTVDSTNAAPVITVPGAQSVDEESSLAFSVSATDANGDTVTFSAASLPSGASFNTATGAFSWTPADGQAGTYTVTFTADDGNGGSDSAAVTITVNGATCAGTALCFETTGSPGGPFRVVVTSDIDVLFVHSELDACVAATLPCPSP